MDRFILVLGWCLLSGCLHAQPYTVAYPDYEPAVYTGVFSLGERVYRVGLEEVIEASDDYGETWTTLTPATPRFNILYARAAGNHAVALIEPTPWAPETWENETHTSVLLFRSASVEPELVSIPWFVPVTESFRRNLNCDVTEDAIFLSQAYTDAALIRSTDDGQTWEQRPLPDSLYNTHYLRFYNRNTGILIAEKIDQLNTWSVFVTHNAGDNWFETPVHVATLRSPKFLPPVQWLSQDSVLVIGDNNETLLSGDGGRTWEVLSINPGLPMITDFLIGRDGRGLIVCEGGRVVRVENFGGDAVTLRNPIYGDGNGIVAYLCNPTAGRLVLADRYGVASWSSDNGVSWTDEKAQLYISPDRLWVFSMDTVFARVIPTSEVRREYGYIRTTDGGNSWSVCIDMSGRDWNSIYFSSPTVWYALRYPTEQDNTVVFRTTDAGNNWSSVYSNSDLDYIRLPDGRCSNGVNGFWFASKSAVIATSDGGNSWHNLDFGADYSVPRHLDISQPPNCYVLTNSQFIRSTDNGSSWQRYPPTPQNWNWWSMAVGEDQRLSFFVREYRENVYKIYSSIDGGASWDTATAGIQLPLMFSRVESTGESAGIIQHPTGKYSLFLSTTNGWRSFHEEDRIYGQGVLDIKFIDADNGWISTSQTIRKTTNGGINWTNVTPPLPQSPRILSTWPQPISQAGMMSTEVELTRPGPVRIELYDLLGRRRAVVWDAEVTATRRTVQWSTIGLERGVYVLRLVTGSGVSNAKLVVE